MLRPPLTSHFDFTALPTVFVREAFAREEAGFWRVYAGVQNDAWQFDETRWWSERDGAFGGGNGLILPPREVAAGLTLQDAALETTPMDARGDLNFDPLLRVPSGTNLVASGSTNYTDALDYRVSPPAQWRLYSAQSGEPVAQAESSGVLGVAEDGSYLLWARCLKPQTDSFGEWSAIKVVVGAGAFSWNGAIYPGPGSPLYSKVGSGEIVVDESNEGDFVHAFDPLARMISASCVVKIGVRTENGQMDIPAGSLLIAGIRASRGGPQTALWLLRENHTARLLAAETSYSNGVCECAKTNHFASDVVQGSDGRIYVLSECDLNVYDPNRSDVFNRLRAFPPETYGHPGGHALRFPNGDLTFWTENLESNQIETGDGRNWYNQLVFRTGMVNNGGIGSRWHGTNCAELFRGKLFAVRQDDDHNLDAEATQTLDSITAGRWDRDSTLTQNAANAVWQRLRRFGANLLLFGYQTFTTTGIDGIEVKTDAPTLHIARERSFESALFPYFIRRATPSNYDDGTPSLLAAARAQTQGIGIANRVVEIEAVTSKLCAVWDTDHNRFAFTQSQFEALGGDLDKLPPFLRFIAQTGSDAGGRWRAAIDPPSSGAYLSFSVESGQIRYTLTAGVMPYNPTFWGVLCIEIDADGNLSFEIGPTCSHAKCVLDLLPAGTKWRHLRLPVADTGAPLWTLQISDATEDKRLQQLRDQLPVLWLRTDSAAPFEQLQTYTIPAKFGREIFLEEPALKWVDVMMIYTSEVLPCVGVVGVRRG